MFRQKHRAYFFHATKIQDLYPYSTLTGFRSDAVSGFNELFSRDFCVTQLKRKVI
jgi:hypothetical protein